MHATAIGTVAGVVGIRRGRRATRAVGTPLVHQPAGAGIDRRERDGRVERGGEHGRQAREGGLAQEEAEVADELRVEIKMPVADIAEHSDGRGGMRGAKGGGGREPIHPPLELAQ